MDMPDRTRIGQAGEAVILARDLQERVRAADQRIAELEREVRDLRRVIADKELIETGGWRGRR